MKYFFLPGLAFCVAGLLMSGCRQSFEEATVARESITESVYASGIVRSQAQYQVFSKVNGVLTRLLVQEGDTVQQGTALFTVKNDAAALSAENAGIAASYASVEANREKLEQARQQIDLAAVTMRNDSLLLARQQNLWEQRIGSRLELEQRELALERSRTNWRNARLNYSSLQKQLRLSEAQANKTLEISQANLSDFTARSTMNGRVYSLLKEEGEMVNTTSPVAILGAAGDFYLELQVDEYDIARIRPGQEVLLRLDSYPDTAFSARVQKIVPLMNERSRSFTVEAVFAQRPPVLYPNLNVEANILISVKNGALTIPAGFLMPGDSVLDANQQKKPVRIGLRDYQKLEVLEGLKAGDIILKPAS